MRKLSLFLLLVVSPGCGVLGTSSPRSVWSEDSAASYAAYLEKNPQGPDAAAARKRLDRLRTVRVKQTLVPTFLDDAAFSTHPGEEGRSGLGPHIEAILDGARGEQLGLRVTKFSLNLDHLTPSPFFNGGESVDLERHQTKAKQDYIGTDKRELRLPIAADAFRAELRLIRSTSQTRFCFLEQNDTPCEDGFEFQVDKTRFQNYSLIRNRPSQAPEVLCSYKMDTHNFAHSDNVTLDPAKKKELDPLLVVQANHDEVRVTYNGAQLCNETDLQLRPGAFSFRSGGLRSMTIEMPGASEPLYVGHGMLAGVEVQEPIPTKGGSKEADAFLADLATYQKFKAGELSDAPMFQESYFELLLGSKESSDKFAEAKEVGSFEALAAFLEAYPVNAHLKEAEQLAFELAANGEELATFMALFPKSDLRLAAKRKAAQLEWDEVVRSDNATSWRAYLAKYPEGYFARRATLLLEGEKQYRANKREFDQRARLIAAAQKAVDRSPITTDYEVKIVDVFDGLVYFNLNKGPELLRRATGVQQLQLRVAQEKASKTTCSLLIEKVGGIENCRSWVGQQTFLRSLPEFYAIERTMTDLDFKHHAKGVPVDYRSLLARLDALDGDWSELYPKMRNALGWRYDPVAFKAIRFAQLGMLEESAYWISVLAKKDKVKRGWANGFLKIEDSTKAAMNHEDFRWLMEHY